MKQNRLLALPQVLGSPGAPRAPRLSQGWEHPAPLAGVTIPGCNFGILQHQHFQSFESVKRKKTSASNWPQFVPIIGVSKSKTTNPSK